MKSSYIKNNGNIYDPKVFNFNHIKNKKEENIYTNLRYLRSDDLTNNNDFSEFNEKKSLTNRNYSNIFSKVENLKMQKDRFQKFYLNKSSSTINSDRKVLQPLTIQLRKNTSKINLKQIISNRLRNELYNVDREEKNNIENNLILSQNDIYNNQDYKSMNILDKFTLFPKHYIYNKFNGKRRTDITNNEFNDKLIPGNNKDYLDYIYKNKEVDLFNKRLLENKNNLKISERNNIILKERNLMKQKNDYFKRMMIKDALYNKKKIKYYKDELDNQMEHFLENKLVNENLKYNQFLKNKDYNRLKTPMMKYLNQNDYFDVNPYNNKSINLGKSNLKYDTILNPRIQFKTNKYLFPEIINSIH